jgi:glyoxylase-like metal-dependent hydrolase (beta-lactamase superfamily II)
MTAMFLFHREFRSLALVAGLAVPASLASQTPAERVARALDAMGGAASVRGVSTVAADYHAVLYQLGQAESPQSPPRSSVVTGRVFTDWSAHRRVRVQDGRTAAGAPVRSRRVTAGGIGLLETDGRFAPDGVGPVAAAERAMRREPDRLLLTALAHPEALSAAGTTRWRGETLDAVGIAFGPDTLTLFFDRYTGLLTGVESLGDHPILGDGRTATWYTRWQEAGGGVRLPRQADVTLNGQAQEHWVFTAVTANAPLDETLFAIPDSIAARAPRGPATPPGITVTLAELAPGVWRAEGASHHSLVVEQERELVLIEAPLSPARVQAVLDTLRARFPGKPVGAVVNTHYHWDHAGGLRAVIVAGIPIVTHERNADFIHGVAAARKTVAPDALARRGRDALLREVTDSLVLGSGERRVVVYVLPTAHGEGMLAAFVPAGGIFFTSDVLPGNAASVAAGSREVMALARGHRLAVRRVAGGHGDVMPWADVERAAAR